ncbi:DUF4255 domain-containing protein [Chitinophagaceae bacterium 26-R-25]|nr:DUF4255 domain-containing protein [Chitinophagaceae bacterium 26-R-25]
MLDLALILLKLELTNYINNLPVQDAVDVELENIGMLEVGSGNTTLSDKIIISIVNIEEESALKNQSTIRRPFLNNAAIVENTPINLNLYVLFTSNFSKYEYALKRLAYVIQFLQEKNTFSSSSPFMPAGNTLNLKFTLDLYTLTFEQINHLWGSLGGRQVPFAMYKLRLVAIDSRKAVRTVPLIEEIDTVIQKNSDSN